MAKIAHFSKYSGGLNKHIEADVYYHLKQSRAGSDGFFFVPIPEEFKELYEGYPNAESFYNRGNSRVIIKGKTADEAQENYIGYLEHFEKQKSDTEKVIMYRFKFTSKNRSSDPVRKSRSGWGEDGLAKTFEAIIEFDYAVCDKTTFGQKVTYRSYDATTNAAYSGRDNFSSVGKKAGGSYGSWVELPYTVEAEAFFGQVYSGMEGIMDRL